MTKNGDGNGRVAPSVVTWRSSMELQTEQSCQQMRQSRLADAGDILDQQMSARQQAGQCQADLPLLAENDGAGLADEIVDDRLVIDGGGGHGSGHWVISRKVA